LKLDGKRIRTRGLNVKASAVLDEIQAVQEAAGVPDVPEISAPGSQDYGPPLVNDPTPPMPGGDRAVETSSARDDGVSGEHAIRGDGECVGGRNDGGVRQQGHPPSGCANIESRDIDDFAWGGSAVGKQVEERLKD